MRYTFEIAKSIEHEYQHPYHAIVWDNPGGVNKIVASRVFKTAVEANMWLHEHARFLGITQTFEIKRTLTR